VQKRLVALDLRACIRNMYWAGVSPRHGQRPPPPMDMRG
jgi:hypothetical protein